MNIVFAHFNTPIPKHLSLNIRRTNYLFPEHDIHLITNLNPKNLKRIDVNVFYFQENREWNLLENQLQHDRRFRGNFWFTSAARFLAFADFSRSNPGELLHLESDVIISRDFPFELFTKSKAPIQFPIVNDTLAIASCLYIKNLKAANYLAKITLNQALCDVRTTDMHILRLISNDKKSGFALLPTAPSTRQSMSKVSKKFLSDNSKSVAYYKGLFDGFNIGRYLFGDDPRNKRGFSKLREVDVNSYLDVRKLLFSMKSNRDFPFVYNFESKKHLPVFALHIHSKKLALFRVKQSPKHIRSAVQLASSPSKTIFSVRTFLKSMIKSLVRRTSKFMSNSNLLKSP